ncbi:MAG TPA: hypothetical protein VIH57_21485 [Bacteroidales bacterium]
MNKVLASLVKKETLTARLLYLGYFVLLIILAAFHSIWRDEMYTLNTTSQDIIGTFKHAISFESQAPLYFIVLKLWRLISDSVFFARLFSIIIMMITVYLASDLAKRYIPWASKYFPFIVALNPFTIWAALEIRVYGTVMLLSTILLILFHEAYLKEDNNKKTRVAMICVAVVSLMTHYFAGFLLAANGLCLLVFGRFKSLKRYVIDMIIPLFLIGIFVLYIAKQFTNHTTAVVEPISILSALKFVFSRFEILLFNFDFFTLTTWQRDVIRFLFLFVLFVSAFKFFDKERYKDFILKNYFLPIVFLIALLFVLVHYVSKGEILLTRHFSILFLPFLLFFVFSIGSLYKPVFYKPLFIVLIFSYVFIDCIVYSKDRMSTVKQSIAFVQRQEKLNEPVLAYRNEIAMDFEWYYKGKNKFCTLPQHIDFSKPYNDDSWVINNSADFRKAISNYTEGTNRFWFIVDSDPDEMYRLRFHYDTLENLLKTDFTIEKDTAINGIRVRLLDKK